MAAYPPGQDVTVHFNPDNAAALMTIGDVDGALVGGASLKADDFAAIIAAF